MSSFNNKSNKKKSNIFNRGRNSNQSPYKAINLNYHYNNTLDNNNIYNKFKKIYNLKNSKDNIYNNNILHNKNMLLPYLNIYNPNDNNKLKLEKNKDYEVHQIDAREKANRKIDYSYMIRNQIGDNIRGARLLKNNLNILLPNFYNINKNYNNINNSYENNYTFKRPQSFSRIGNLIILDNNSNNIYKTPFKYHQEYVQKNNIVNSPYFRRLNNNEIHKQYFNNSKFNMLNKNNENIFMKEDYSSKIRKINGSRLKNQREKKYEDYFNIVINYPKIKNLFNQYDQNKFGDKKHFEENIDEFESDKEDEKILDNISDSEEKSNNKKNLEESEDIKYTDENHSESNEDNSQDEDEEIEDLLNYDNPIEDQMIENLPVTKLTDINKLSDENKKCTICFEIFNKDDNIIYLPCIHIYHEECIKKWFKVQDFCPICRFKITAENINQIII